MASDREVPLDRPSGSDDVSAGTQVLNSRSAQVMTEYWVYAGSNPVASTIMFGRVIQQPRCLAYTQVTGVQLSPRLPFATFVYRLGSSPFKRGKRDRHPQVVPSMPAPADPASGLRNRHAEVRLFPWAPFKAAPLGRSCAFEARAGGFDSRRGPHHGFEAQREEHPVPSRADAGSSPAGTTIARRAERYAASGRHAMTPSVRARTSGGARHEASAS
jgi:hypothetical protein